MKAKEQIFDFLNLIFIIVLVGFCILFFIVPERFNAFSRILESLMPLVGFSLLFFIKLKYSREEFRERNKNNDIDVTLYLSYTDKLKSDLVIFGLPIIMLGLAFFVNDKIDLVDTLQAGLVFLSLYLWQKLIFNKGR